MVYIYDSGTWLLHIPFYFTDGMSVEDNMRIFSHKVGYRLFKYVCIDPVDDKQGLFMPDNKFNQYTCCPMICMQLIDKTLVNEKNKSNFEYIHAYANDKQSLFEAWSYCDLAYLPSCGIVM